MTISNTGIPTVMNKSMVISRRFCKQLGDLFLETQRCLVAHHRLGSWQGGCDDVNVADNAKRTSRPRDCNTDLNANSWIEFVRDALGIK